MGDSDTGVVSVRLVVTGGPVDTVDISGGLEVAVAVVVLSVTRTAADQEVLSVVVVEVDTGGLVAVSGEGIAGVVIDALVSVMATFSVGVLQSVAVEVEGDGAAVVGAMWIMVVVGNSGAVVVEVVRSVEMVGKIVSVVKGGVLMCGVVLLVVKVAAGVTDSIIFVDVISGKDIVLVSTKGEAGSGRAVVKAVLGKAGGMNVVVSSTVESVVLVSVCAEEAVVGTVAVSVTTEVSETGAGLGPEVVMIGVVPVECVVASVVSTATGALLVVVPSIDVGVLAAVVVASSMVTGVVEKSGFWKSVGLVEVVSQNRGVTAKGVLLVLDVLGPKGLTAELSGPVIHVVVPVIVVGGASVTLTVDNGSTTSGLTAVGTIGGDGGSTELEGVGVAEGEMKAGGVCEEVV